jgi:hypothetical protein
MRVLYGKQQTVITEECYIDLTKKFSNVHYDLGTGSGRYVMYHAAGNKTTLYVGIDPAASNMEAVSSKVIKQNKRAKKTGGDALGNTLFVIASIEKSPAELHGKADSISIILPWGSLRDAIVTAHIPILQSIRSLGREGTDIWIVVGYENEREASEIQNRKLPELSLAHFQALRPIYATCGINIKSVSEISNDRLRTIQSYWARKLGYGLPRVMYEISGLYE